jgi:hypothetical protein
MARAKQSAVGDTAQAQFSLLMWTGAFAREDLIAIPNEQEVHSLQPRTNNRLICETVR